MDIKRILRYYLLEIVITVSILVIVTSLYCWGRSISYVDKQIKIYGISASILGLYTSLLIALINHKNSKNREISILIQKEKQNAYMHFYNAVFEGLKKALQSRNDEQKEESKKEDKKVFDVNDKMLVEMLEFKKGLMIWGSQELIDAFLKYNKGLFDDKVDKYDNTNEFLIAIRKDLQHTDNRKIKLYDILLKADAVEHLKSPSKNEPIR